jgi:histidinol dehydrogenase
VQTENARELATKIVRAGALFVGPMTPKAAGDYVAGPSHVLPTGCAVRFGALLGVYDFVSRS